MSPQTAPAHPERTVELGLLAVAAIVIGPLAFALGALTAHIGGGRRRWVFAATIPSALGSLLAWPLIHHHLIAALAVLDGLAATHDRRSLLAVWPQIWPAWLASGVLAPIVASAFLIARRPGAFDPEPPEPTTTRLLPAERRIAARATRVDHAPTSDAGLFLGYRIGGDDLLACRRGEVYLPLDRLARHLLVAGAPGSGKTETVLRISDSVAKETDWTIIYIDGKGDRENMARFAELMEARSRRVWCFPDECHDGWRGDASEVSGRLLELVDFADQGGGAYYRDLAVNTIHLACTAPAGPPRSSGEFFRRLHRDNFRTLHPASSAAAIESAAVTRAQLDGIRARYTAFFSTVGNALDGKTSFDEIDTAYLLLDGLRLKREAGYLARFLVEDFTQWAAGRKPRAQRVLLIVDEFSALAVAGHALVDVIERMRGFGVAAILCPQLAEGMGGSEAAARIIGSAQTILLHAMATPRPFVEASGTRRVYATSRELEGSELTGRGSIRPEDRFRVDPNAVRRLAPGQCFAIGSGLAMKLQIAATPGSRERESGRRPSSRSARPGRPSSSPG